MKVGFTGTRKGMTKEQHDVVTMLADLMHSSDLHEARHGMCIGADAQFNSIFGKCGYITYGYPASDVDSTNRAHCSVNFTMPAAPALTRNHTIVDESEVMIATPKGYEEEWRGSGTWAAIRYSAKSHKPTYIVYPNGKVELLNASDAWAQLLASIGRFALWEK